MACMPRAFALACGILQLGFSAWAADASVSSTDELYRGWLKMYDLKFDEAHQVFNPWKQSHPQDSLGPASNAAAYLFSELARLGTLESELFTDNNRFVDRAKLHPDPEVRTRFNEEIERAEQLADAALKSS